MYALLFKSGNGQHSLCWLTEWWRTWTQGTWAHPKLCQWWMKNCVISNHTLLSFPPCGVCNDLYLFFIYGYVLLNKGKVYKIRMNMLPIALEKNNRTESFSSSPKPIQGFPHLCPVLILPSTLGLWAKEQSRPISQGRALHPGQTETQNFLNSSWGRTNRSTPSTVMRGPTSLWSRGSTLWVARAYRGHSSSSALPEPA